MTIKDPQLIFLKLLESELDRTIIPGSGSEMSRQIATLAARQLRRLLIDKTVVPQLRIAAIADYKALLPQLRARIDDERHTRLARILNTADALDWALMEAMLYEVTAALLATEDQVSSTLAGQLVAIDMRMRAAKEEAWIASGTPKPVDAEGSVPGGFTDAEQARLLHFIEQRFPNETALRIAGVKPIPGGFSKQTLFIDLEGTLELPTALVMRRDGPYATTGSSVTMEYPVIQKMYAAGVAVPKPFAVDEKGEVFGKPFILVARAPGRTLGDFISVAEPSREVALDLARKMAQLHAVSIDGLEDILAGGRTTVRERLLAEIEQHDAMWKGVVHHQAYVVQLALDWLKRNIQLADGPRAVVHRDIGLHNMLVEDDVITVFLDWETAVVGTPAEDVAYAYYTAVQMIEWEQFLAAYEAAAGMTLNRQQLDYYMLWASVRVAVGINRLVDPVFAGERLNLPEYYLGDYFGQVLMQRIATKLAEVLK